MDERLIQRYHEANRKYIDHCDLCVGEDFLKCKKHKPRDETRLA